VFGICLALLSLLLSNSIAERDEIEGLLAGPSLGLIPNDVKQLSGFSFRGRSVSSDDSDLVLLSQSIAHNKPSSKRRADTQLAQFGCFPRAARSFGSVIVSVNRCRLPTHGFGPSSRATNDLLAAVRRTFEYIVNDSPPCSRSVIMVVESEATSQEAAIRDSKLIRNARGGYWAPSSIK